jgi:hypothetical protein
MGIRDKNFPGLLQLSEDCGYQALLMNLSAHRRSAGLADGQITEI